MAGRKQIPFSEDRLDLMLECVKRQTSAQTTTHLLNAMDGPLLSLNTVGRRMKEMALALAAPDVPVERRPVVAFWLPKPETKPRRVYVLRRDEKPGRKVHVTWDSGFSTIGDSLR